MRYGFDLTRLLNAPKYGDEVLNPFLYSSPLRPSTSAGNRGRANLASRKRGHDGLDDNSSAPPPSSPPPSSPPMLPLDEVDEDDDMAPEEGFVPDIDDMDEMGEDDDGIDLFAGNFERDYRDRADDHYGGVDIDDADQEELDIGTRRQLESRLNKRDREIARRRKMPAAFLQEDDLD
ncbi:hypothetical protein FQN49_008178, partial [Arthroderma sp. PD_2]